MRNRKMKLEFTEQEKEALQQLRETLLQQMRNIPEVETDTLKGFQETLKILNVLGKEKEKILHSAMKRHAAALINESGICGLSLFVEKNAMVLLQDEEEDCRKNPGLAYMMRSFVSLVEDEGKTKIFFKLPQLKKWLFTYFKPYIDICKTKEEKETITKSIENAIFNSTILHGFKDIDIKEAKKTTANAENIIIPKTAALLLDKITKNALDVQTQQGKQKLRIALDANKEDLVLVALENLETELRLTYFEQMTLEAVISLLEKGNIFIPYASIYKVMTGGKRASSAGKEQIRNSLWKLRSTSLNAQFQKPKKIKGTKTELKQYQGYILAADEMTLVVKGKETQGIRIIEKPWFYLWAKESGQIQRVPLSLLAVDVGRGKNSELILNYLLRRIEIIKRRKGDNHTGTNKILLSTIIEKTSDREYKGATARNHKANVVRIVKKALDQWQKEGYIQGYQIEKEGKSIRAFEIFVRDC